MFLDAIGELVRPTRTALLLSEGRDYRVAAHRGLAPQIVESVRLPAAQGLAHWLATQGRPARAHELTDAEPLHPSGAPPRGPPAPPPRRRPPRPGDPAPSLALGAPV